MSTKTGVAPARRIASPVAVNVNDGVRILSVFSKCSFPFSFKAIARRLITKASVPEETPRQYLTLRYLATSSSRAFTSGPRIHCWCCRHF